MALKFPDILKSNNPSAYGIVDAKEIVGHRTVATVEDLLNIPLAILGDDSIGLLWYVLNELQFYQLIKGSKWKKYSGGVLIVDSVKDLDELAEIGSIAIVRDWEEYPLSAFQGGSASGIIISAPESLDLGENQVTFVKDLYFYVYNADFDGNPTTQASMLARLLIGKTPTTSSDAAWGMYGLIYGGSSLTLILFEYDTTGSLIRYNEDTINKFIYLATSTPSGGGGKIIGGVVSKPTEDIITYFGPFVSFKTPIRPLLYTKLSQGWRLYDELVNGSVTLEKLSEDLQQSINNINIFLDASDQSDEVIDTLKEIQEYIESDESGAAAMVESIASNKNEIELLKQKIQYLTEEEYNTLITEGKINEDVIYIVTYNE